MTGRVFGASLKPVWSETKIHEFLNRTRGDIMVYIINHNQDTNELGERVEAHTHIYLEYVNPRKLTTVANLLGVEANFIEIIRNKKGYLRYLTHLDEEEKHRYEASEVYTNSEQEYSMRVRGNAITDKEIAEYLKQGRGMELLGLVSASRLRTIQSFMHFDNSNQVLAEIRHLNSKMDGIIEVVDNVDSFIKNAGELINSGIMSMSESFEVIAAEMTKVRKLAVRGGRKN